MYIEETEKWFVLFTPGWKDTARKQHGLGTRPNVPESNALTIRPTKLSHKETRGLKLSLFHLPRSG